MAKERPRSTIERKLVHAIAPRDWLALVSYVIAEGGPCKRASHSAACGIGVIMIGRRNKGLSTSLFCALLVGVLVVQVKPSLGRPGSIMSTVSSTSVGAPTQEKRDIGAGDASYASRTGAFEYSYPIVVPPGRLGMQPSLALSYSSQGSLRGGVAANWSLNVPMIQRDTSEGSLGMAPGATDHEELPFTSSMSGGHRLVSVDEPVEQGWDSYRAEYDDQYIRYERDQTSGTWRARTLDGKTWFFGIGHAGEEVTLDTDSPPPLIASSSGDTPLLERQDHLPLTRVVDRFGNTIRYYWELEADVVVNDNPREATELRLVEIRYSENIEAGLGSHARVKFDYAPPSFCSAVPLNAEVPIGASVSFRGGLPWYEGRQRLKSITTHVEGQTNAVRHVELEISDRCPGAGGSHRRLDAIRTVDPVSLAPLTNPVEFEYGPEARTFGAQATQFDAIAVYPGTVQNAFALYWGREYGYGTAGVDLKAEPTLEQTLLDFNGDGLLDVLRSSEGGACSFEVLENDGTGILLGAPTTTIDFPYEGMLWADGTSGPTGGTGEGCSLTGRRTLWQNTPGGCNNDHYGNYIDHRFIDMNNDGLPDLVTSIRVSERANPQLSEVPGVSEVLGLSAISNESAPPFSSPPCTSYYENSDFASIARTALVPSCEEGTQNCDTCTFADMSVVEPLLALGQKGECGSPNAPFNALSSVEINGSWAVDENDATCGSAVPLRRDSRYPWMVYYNTGGALQTTFIPGSPQPTDPQRVWSPIPLDPAGAESSIGSNNGGGMSSAKHAITDITGDGIVDAISISPSQGFPYWSVFAGQVDEATGQFTGFAANEQWWTVPSGAKMSSTTGTFDGPAEGVGASQTQGLSQLVDINGDGLPDLLEQAESGNGLAVAYNMGSGFCADDGTPGLMPLISSEDRLSRTGFFPVKEYCVQLLQVNPIAGSTKECTRHNYIVSPSDGFAIGKSLSRLVDVDQDGLVDFYNAWAAQSGLAVESGFGLVYSGTGGAFESDWGGTPLLSREHVLVDATQTWEVLSELLDLDGDGLADKVEATPNGWELKSEVKDGSALRLLTGINNGQGLSTNITYKPYNDPDVASSANTGVTMKTPVWVTQSVTTHLLSSSNFDPAPDSEVELRYGDAVYNQNHRGRYGFRGFESIETSSPHAIGATSGFAVTEQKYGYGLDWSGRLSETVVYADGFAKQQASSIVEKTHKLSELFSGASTSFVPWLTITKNCGVEDGSSSFVDYATCSSRPKDFWTSVGHVAVKAASGSVDRPPLAYVHTAVVSLIAPSFSNGAKIGVNYHRLYSDEQTYWLMYYGLYTDEWQDGGWVDTSKFLNYADSNKKYIQKANRMTGPGKYVHDRIFANDFTGNTVEKESRNGYGTGLKTTFGYSGFEISAVSVTNELGQTTTTETDLGTGNTLESYGPNALDCNPSKKAGIRTSYDGLGRPLDVEEFGCASGSFGKDLLSSTEYVDFNPATGIPAHATTTTFLDVADPTKTTKSTVFVDGAGRVIRTEIDDGTSEPIATSSVFNARGLMERSRAPDPSALPGVVNKVDATYAYDSLGRITGIRQGTSGADAPTPGAPDWDSYVGANISYGFDGTRTIKTTTEHVTDSGSAGETRTYSDFFGRLVQVDELSDGGTYATTEYEYDGNDNMSRILDADGIATLMEHDWLSRRTKITRGERVWTYAYDKNGNMVMETSPNNLGETADNPGLGLYSSSTVYDALDRPLSRLLAERGLSQAQLNDFDSREAGFVYDTCTNGIGRLCSVTSGLNHTTNYAYDYAGRVEETTQSITLPENVVDFGDADTNPDFVESRTTYTEYNLAGGVTDVWLSDGGAQDDSTHVRYTYDETGTLDSLRWLGSTNQPTDVLTTVVRNKAQRVKHQTTGCLSRQWSYDYLGRVLSTNVNGIGCLDSNGNPGTNGDLLHETMTYYDSSELDTHDVYRGVSVPERHFAYEYDDQHQLIGATNTIGNGSTSDYNVGFQYTDAGRIISVGDYLGSSIAGRDAMDYAGGYGDGTLAGGDFHAPVELLGTGGNGVEYDYDFSGNATRREEADAATIVGWDFEYDGANQQREVLLENGTGGRELYYYDSAGQRYMAVTFNTWDIANPPSNPIPDRIRVWMGGAEIWYSPDAASDVMDVETEYAYLTLGGLSVGRIKTEEVMGSRSSSGEASFHNGLSHLMAAIDWDTGVASAAFVYGPYGELIDTNGGEEDTHLRRFNGKEADQLSKLSYYGYRYYDPLSLTWTQADPLYRFVPDFAHDEPRRMSLYAFSLNNPVRYLDPDGRDPGEESSRVILKQGHNNCFGGSCGAALMGVGRTMVDPGPVLTTAAETALVVAPTGRAIRAMELAREHGGDLGVLAAMAWVEVTGGTHPDGEEFDIQSGTAPPPPGKPGGNGRHPRKARAKEIKRGVNGAKKHNSKNHNKKSEAKAKAKARRKAKEKRRQAAATQTDLQTEWKDMSERAQAVYKTFENFAKSKTK